MRPGSAPAGQERSPRHRRRTAALTDCGHGRSTVRPEAPIRAGGPPSPLRLSVILTSSIAAQRLGTPGTGRVGMWRGGGRSGLRVGRPFRLAVPQWPGHGSVSTSRSSAGSKTGAPTVGSGGGSPAFAMALSPAPVVTFPASAASNPACRFPAPGFPADFTPRVMGPIALGVLSADVARPDSRSTSQALGRAIAYSTCSSQNPDAGAPASGGALPSSRPSPAHSQDSDSSAPHGSSSPIRAAPG
jgi:hypothetical protein